MPSHFEHGHALIIGIAGYPEFSKLPDIVLKDARNMRDLLVAPQYCGYIPDNVHTLIDGQATHDRIITEMDRLAETVTSKSTALIYFTGHGGRPKDGNASENYLLPYNFNPKDIVNTALFGTAFTKLLRKIKAERVVTLFDCCHAGGIGEPKAGLPDPTFEKSGLKSGLDEAYYQQLSRGKGRVIMASSRTSEVSMILHGAENSLFTQHLIDALKGKARHTGDGLIRVFEVFDYVSVEVPKHAFQNPVFKANDLETNFPVSLFCGGIKSGEGPAGDSGPKPPSATHHKVNKSDLRRKMAASFDLEDIEMLCADIQQRLEDDGIHLRVGIEEVGGRKKEAIILNLINYLDRPGHLGYMVSAVTEMRPDLLENGS